MFVILHCRVLLPYLCLPYPLWCISLVYLLGDTSFCTAFIGSPCCNACLPSLSQSIPVQLTAEPMCNRYRTENKAYQHIIPKAALLSLLSTTIGPEHKSPLPNGVVNPWQPEFDTQCGVYGWWIGPQTYQNNAELLGDIASHPQVRQHHQLAHVSQPVANSRSHTKKQFLSMKEHLQTYDIYSEADIRQCVTPLHTPIVLWQSVLEDSAQLPLGDCELSYCNPLHSWGECGDWKEPHRRGGSSNSIPRWTGSLQREVVPGSTWAGEDDCTVNFVIVSGALNIESARDTELWKCQGHWTLKVPGALKICCAMGMFKIVVPQNMVIGLVQVRLIFHFSAAVPTPDQSWGLFA